jgi:hypothetical protein
LKILIEILTFNIFIRIVKKIFFIYFSNIIAIFLIVTNAYAYLDPGTGSFILQAIIGFLAALSAGFLYYWTKVKNFFLKLFKKNNNDEKTDN